jgi:hypothetical protein
MGQHYAPQAYLRPFQALEAPGMVWTYPRDGDPRLVPIKNVAQATGFYEPDQESDLHTYIEAPTNPILAKLRRGETINREERERVAIYVATMVSRVPRQRERGEALIAEAQGETLARARKALRIRAALHGTPPERLEKWLDNVSIVERQWSVETPASVIEEVRSPWPHEIVIRLIYGMQWRVVVADPPEMFITSDNPAFFFESIGMAKDHAEVSFPLSPTSCLHCCHQPIPGGGDLAFMPFNRELVREMNRRTASAATSIVMAHERHAWPLKLLRKQNLYLSRINWTN